MVGDKWLGRRPKPFLSTSMAACALAMSASETRVARAKAAPGEWDGIGFSDSLVSGSHSGRGTDKLDMVRCASES